MSPTCWTRSRIGSVVSVEGQGREPLWAALSLSGLAAIDRAFLYLRQTGAISAYKECRSDASDAGQDISAIREGLGHSGRRRLR
jgi:hypothetical protein